MFKKISFIPFIIMSCFVINVSKAASVYDNSISALNINMLTQNLMSYTHQGEYLSQIFGNKKVYGTMTRFDEYGDDGSTLKSNQNKEDSDNFLLKDIWANVQIIDTKAHYAPLISERSRFNLFTIGTETQNINLTYGDISFGGFVGYITGDVREYDSNGNHLGLFARYEYKDFDITAMVNNGSINNDSNFNDFNNAWFNVAMDTSWKIKIDNTFYFQPQIYAGYTWISSDNLYLNGDNISSKNFMLLNIAPGARFVKNIVDDWYAAMSVKYTATIGDDKDIYVNGIKYNGVSLDNYVEAGIDLEYDYEQFIFTGAVHKQIGGFDGWVGNINVKYLF